MARKSSDIETVTYLRSLVLGGPKSGKTTTVISTAPGPVYVINSDDKQSLNPARRRCEELGLRDHFEWELALGTDLQAIETCIAEARKGVKEGRYKTIVWDTISMYARRVEDIFAKATMNAAGEPDGRRFWPAYHKHLQGVVDRLCMLNAHVIVNAHYMSAGAVIDGQIEKTGEGICPLLKGESRQAIPALFQDVIFLEVKNGERFFTTNATGVWGPGCRNLPGTTKVPANVKELWGLMQGESKKEKGKK